MLNPGGVSMFLTVFLLLWGQTNARQAVCHHTKDMDQIRFNRLGRFTDHHITRRDAGSSFSESFQMEFEFDSSFTTGLSEATANRIQTNILPKLKEFFESVLSIKPQPGPITYQRDCSGDNGLFYTDGDGNRYCVYNCKDTTTCGTATIPSHLLNRCRECSNDAQQFEDCSEYGTDGAGIDASFVLFVTAVTEGSCPEVTSDTETYTIAFAGACELEDEHNRPIGGYVNFCPLSINGNNSDEYLIAVAKHEILHALGFSSALFEYWVDENGNTRNPLKEVTYNDWSTYSGGVSHTVNLLTSPRIVVEGKAHFNCSTLEGVQLEDQGGDGTTGSHWEARITRGEGMNGVISDDIAFSRLTFAALEDSGWYGVNYDLAEQLVWGRGSGCELAAGSCGGYMKQRQQQGKSISPFCDYTFGDGPYLCNLHRTGVSYCNRVVYPAPIPAQYRYFEDSRLGGSLEVADYCPFQQAFTDTVCADTANSQTGLDNFLAQSFGPNSRCVEHGQLEWTAEQGGASRNNPVWNAGCYDYTCSDGNVIIHILDESYNCTVAGQEFNIAQTSTDGVTYTGSIKCPSCLEICYDDFDNCPEAATLYSNPPPSAAPYLMVTQTLLAAVLLVGNVLL